MKNIYIALGFVLATATTNLSAQSAATKNADKLFNQFEYVKAAQQYLQLTTASPKADPYIYKQLADSYYNMFNTAEATKWYAKATETAQSAETYYRYAQMLKASGSYDQADKQMQQFAAKAPSDARAKAFLANPNYLAKLQSQSKSFDIKKLDISGDQSDFGAVLNNNTLYFASWRHKCLNMVRLSNHRFF